MSAIYLQRAGIVMGGTPLNGEGAPIICLPGLGFSSTYLATAMTEAPLRGRAALLVDLPGTGMTEPLPHRHDIAAHAAAVAEYLDTLGLSAAPVFGHSLGGTVGIELARSRPDLVSRLLVAEGNLTPGGGGASRAMSQGTREDFIAAGFAKLLDGRRASAVSGDAIPALLYAGRIGSDARAIFETAGALVDLDTSLEEAFLSMTIPRVFIYGSQSLPASAAEATPDAPDPQALRQRGVEIEIIPDAGHLMVFENPRATAEAIVRHL
jgi:pimeloyl-ACP methyl ester carboxylesterase